MDVLAEILSPEDAAFWGRTVNVTLNGAQPTLQVNDDGNNHDARVFLWKTHSYVFRLFRFTSFGSSGVVARDPTAFLATGAQGGPPST